LLWVVWSLVAGYRPVVVGQCVTLLISLPTRLSVSPDVSLGLALNTSHYGTS